MTGLDSLRCVAQGRRPDGDGLLGSTRFAWGQQELLSEEALLASFAARPFDLEPALLALETSSGAALIGENRALVADVYRGRIGRLWRVGEELDHPSEQAIDVSFDTDLRQERGGVNFRAEDHPDLDPAAAEQLQAAASDLVEEERRGGKLRVRAFFVRAFGTPQASAALLSLFTLDNEAARTAAFAYAVVGIGPDAHVVTTIYNPAPHRVWNPRL